MTNETGRTIGDNDRDEPSGWRASVTKLRDIAGGNPFRRR